MTRDALEQNQVPIYFVAVIVAAIAGLLATTVAQGLSVLVTPAIAVLMYAMFLQIPFLNLRDAGVWPVGVQITGQWLCKALVSILFADRTAIGTNFRQRGGLNRAKNSDSIIAL